MGNTTEDVLFEAHVRVRVARWLVDLLCAQRTDHGWSMAEAVDDCLQRLSRQLDLLSSLTDTGLRVNNPWHADSQPSTVLRIHDVLSAGPHD